MTARRSASVVAHAVLAAAGATSCRDAEPAVAIAAGIDHSRWDRLLAKYVDDRGEVDYARWKADAADRLTLADYLGRIAAPARVPAEGNDAAASLVNAYNALVVSWILEDDHYPTASIRRLSASFSRARHTIAGRLVSLDAIERETLRPQLGFLANGALACAARSCPPLFRRAYRPEHLTNDLAFALRRWLDRPDLNEFLPYENRVRISRIFDWYAADFENAPGGLRGVLSLYAPARYQAFLAKSRYTIRYMPYDWGLNETGPAGRAYGGLPALWDRLHSR